MGGGRPPVFKDVNLPNFFKSTDGRDQSTESGLIGDTMRSVSSSAAWLPWCLGSNFLFFSGNAHSFDYIYFKY